jgi:hypothetical protein
MAEPNVEAIDKAYNLTGGGYSGFALSLDDAPLADLSNVLIPVDKDNPYPLNKDSVAEFNNRYVSLDGLNASEDGSDLAYMRILEFNNGKFGQQVFPLALNKQELKYKEFIITSIQNAYVEKAQILKTNNTLQIYAFDSQPEVLNIQGILKSTQQDRWDIAILLVWDDIFRLTKLVQRSLIAEFGYESNVYWGFPLNFAYQKSSQAQYLASFSMQFLIVRRSVIAKQSNIFVDDIIRQLKEGHQG